MPILILVFIGSFSLPELFRQQEIPEGDINIKVTGYQWYWGYEYTDHEFGFESFMLAKDQTWQQTAMPKTSTCWQPIPPLSCLLARPS